MRISEMTDASLITSLSSASEQKSVTDLSWMTGTVTEMAKARVAASGTSATAADNSSVAVNFSQNAKELKQLKNQQTLMAGASETLGKMKTLADADLTGKSDSDKIAAGVEYRKLQRQLSDYSSKSLLSEASATAAKEDKKKVDVMAVALAGKFGSSGLSDKLSAAQSFVETSQGVIDDKVDALTAKKKTLSSGMTSLYSSAQGVEG